MSSTTALRAASVGVTCLLYVQHNVIADITPSMMAALSYLCLIICSVVVSGQLDLSSDASQSLLSLLTEERTLRAQLEAEADSLETELNDLKVLRQNATCGCPMSAAPIAFSAVLTTNINTFGKQQIVVFDKVQLNVGNGYDARHGTFTAPVPGAYEFTAAILVAAGYKGSAEIVHNNQSRAKIRTGDNSYYTMGINVVILQLMAGDEVFVRHLESDNNKLWGESHTSFSGHLIEG